jgi:hypothetical protein
MPGKPKQMRGFRPGTRSGNLFARKQAEILAAREMTLLRQLDSSVRRDEKVDRKVTWKSYLN